MNSVLAPPSNSGAAPFARSARRSVDRPRAATEAASITGTTAREASRATSGTSGVEPSTTSARKPKANHGTGACTGPAPLPPRRDASHQPRISTAGASRNTRASFITVPDWDASAPPAAAAPTACTTSWTAAPAHRPWPRAPKPSGPASRGRTSSATVPHSVMTARAYATSSSLPRTTWFAATMADAPQIAVPIPMSCASGPSTPILAPSHTVTGSVSATTVTASASAPGPSPRSWPSVTCNPSSTMAARSTGRTQKARPGLTAGIGPSAARIATPAISATTTGFSAARPLATPIRIANSAINKQASTPGARLRHRADRGGAASVAGGAMDAGANSPRHPAASSRPRE